MKILLLEDNLRLNKVIMNRLLERGHTVDSFSDGEKANEAIDNGYRCFIIEAKTSNFSGIDMLKKIRSYYKDIPVVMMHLKDKFESKIIKDAYFNGCSDFIKNPFFIDELEVRIEKLCNIRKDIVNIGMNCTYDFRVGILHIGIHDKQLSKKEKLLFDLLFFYKGNAVYFETIKVTIWEGECVSLDSIRALVKRLRKKIPFNCISAVLNIGYVLKLSNSR